MRERHSFKDRLHEIIFEADTPAGKFFDIALIVAIIASVVVVMLDSVGSIHRRFEVELYALEWFFTILFTIEYLLRLYSVESQMKYVRSFFGIVDLLSILPTYVSLLVPGSQYLLAIRALRTVRIWRILKLSKYLREFDMLLAALRASSRKITVFLSGVLALVVVFGSAMYLVEGGGGGFTSIPRSIYWAIVTLTTVGYGDISPQTALGQFLAALVMIMGYAIIAVPTGIVTVEIAQATQRMASARACRDCSREGHDANAVFCKYCGHQL